MQYHSILPIKRRRIHKYVLLVSYPFCNMLKLIKDVFTKEHTFVNVSLLTCICSFSNNKFNILRWERALNSFKSLNTTAILESFVLTIQSVKGEFSLCFYCIVDDPL